MQRVLTIVMAIVGVCSVPFCAVNARGVSPYLPLNLDPAMERKIERVLILGDKPVMRRPIAAAMVLEALPKACKRDEQLCEEVRQYLDRYMHTANVTALRVEVAATSGQSQTPIPNEHGMPVNSGWDASASAYYQPSDYLLVNASTLGYQGRMSPTGSVVSMGFDFAQLDIGYRDHWLSPNTDSSMLMGTEAPTMPSVTLSNYLPISPLGINYEVFLAKMSTQQDIQYYDTTTTGQPHLAGLQVGIEPASGYALAVNRLFQYGGGARGGAGLDEFYKALFDNGAANNADGSQGLEFGNQQASVTASALFQWRVPFAVHIEYAAEDNTYAGDKYFGDTDLTLGIDIPKIWNDYDFTYEVSEWQNAWYIHHLYPLGMTNDGLVLGNWFGDERIFNDAIGGHSQMVRVGRRWGDDYLQVTYRDMGYDIEWAGVGATRPYQQLRELDLRYTTAWHGHALGTELFVGKDVFGKSFARLSGSIDIASNHGDVSELDSNDDTDDVTDTALFVDLGVSMSRVTEQFYVLPSVSTDYASNAHVGVGARRQVSDQSDIGVRLEVDQANGYNLWALRAIDYRYRFNHTLAMTAFFGVGRYDVGLPAYGWYSGLGAQYMNLFKHWDLNFDWYQYSKLNRDAVLANDLPPNHDPNQTRVFYGINGVKLYVSRRF